MDVKDDSNNNNNSIFNDNSIKEINIKVKERSFCKKYKKLIIIISSIIGILIIIGAIVLIVILTKSKDKKKDIDIEEESSDTSKITNDIDDDKCISGYYIPDDDPTLKDCQKCSLEGCIKCSGTYNNNICTDCGNLVSVIENGKIIKCNTPSKNKILCEIGQEEKCLTCVENKKECKTCNIAYKLVEGKCEPISL